MIKKAVCEQCFELTEKFTSVDFCIKLLPDVFRRSAELCPALDKVRKQTHAKIEENSVFILRYRYNKNIDAREIDYFQPQHFSREYN